MNTGLIHDQECGAPCGTCSGTWTCFYSVVTCDTPRDAHICDACRTKEIRKHIDCDEYPALCPRCGTEVDYVSSGHERDSSNDYRKCPKCKWQVSQMELWGEEDDMLREELLARYRK